MVAGFCRLLLVGLAAAANVGCGKHEPPARAADVAPAAPSASAPATTRPPIAARKALPCAEPRDAGKASALVEVDWCNFEYLPGLIGLRAGRGEIHEYVELGGMHDTDLYWLRSVSYVDLDGDPAAEAVIVIDEQHYVGAPQHPWDGTRLFVFQWRTDHPALLAETSLAPAEDVTVVGRTLRVTTRAPERSCRQSYVLAGTKIAPEGVAECSR